MQAGHRLESPLSDTTQRLTPRSAVASADYELLRVARADLDEREGDAGPSLADRLRGLSPFRAVRPGGGDSAGPVRLDAR
jgi:hypothetical protein